MADPAATTTEPVRLNLGGGDIDLPGYVNIDRKSGREAYPLDYPDNSVDEIRASHLIEHFGHQETVPVVKDWVRALKPGGVLKIATVDIDKVVQIYAHPPREGTPPVEGWMMGGQTDENDFHKAIFSRRKLWAILHAAGLMDIQDWASNIKDCASLPISLNMEGRKPQPGFDIPNSASMLRIEAAMSTPRLGFMENYFSCYRALLPFGIDIKIQMGAYWGQCLENAMEDIQAEGNIDAILTIDYDSVFTKEDVFSLMRLMMEHPEADAICALQAKRSSTTPLLTMLSEDGTPARQMSWREFEPAITKIHTGHFGLTLIRVSSLADVPHPWFVGVPNEEGRWREGRTDADIYFWKNWTEHGKTLYLANHVVAGHCELMVAWPDLSFQTMHQHVCDYEKVGKPEGVWR